METKDDAKKKPEEAKDQPAGREQLDLEEIEDLAGGKKKRSKPIKLPEI